eukprot:1596155-Rhodomonas_salina.3
MCYALREALEMVKEEGLEARWARHQVWRYSLMLAHALAHAHAVSLADMRHTYTHTSDTPDICDTHTTHTQFMRNPTNAAMLAHDSPQTRQSPCAPSSSPLHLPSVLST